MQKSSRFAAGNAAVPARRTVAAVADAAQRWCDADFPPRVRATRAIRERTGYSEQVVDYALDRLFCGLNREALEGSIAGELGSLGALDGFVPRQGRPAAHAAPVGRVLIVASDTTIGVALAPAVFALCAGCPTVVRDRSDALVSAFAETLAEERAGIAERLHVLAAASHDDDAYRRELEASDAVVAFGGSEALRAIRARLRPHARFVPFASCTSASYVEREALSDEVAARALAERVAADALLYDGEGCLSSHAVFVESGATIAVQSFARLVNEACARVAVLFPGGRDGLAPGSAGYRDASRFRASTGRGTLLSAALSDHVVVLDAPRDEPPPLAPRTLALYSVVSAEELEDFVRAHALPLEAVAVAAPPPREDVLRAIVASGAARIARAGDLQSPSFAGEHGGVGRIAPFVRWITRDP